MKWKTAWTVSTVALAIVLFMNISAWAQAGGSQPSGGQTGGSTAEAGIVLEISGDE